MAVGLSAEGSTGDDPWGGESSPDASAGSNLPELSGVDSAVLERQHAVGILHPPVLLEEVVQGLALKEGALVLDATVGLGGHAERILEATAPTGRLVAIDRDPEALEAAQRRLERFGDRTMWIHGNFGELAQRLSERAIGPLDAALFDLGVSTLQLKRKHRGFSFLLEGPLDMRMDPTDSLTAAEIVNHTSQRELTDLIRSYGQDRWAGRIARAIVRGRPFRTTMELAQAIRKAVPPTARHGKIDPATRTFQAIRIAVNGELELLPKGLEQAVERLKGGGRIAALAYHSLEDRIVKELFRRKQKEGLLSILTRKPIRPEAQEIARNPSARSARLRIAQKQ